MFHLFRRTADSQPSPGAPPAQAHTRRLAWGVATLLGGVLVVAMALFPMQVVASGAVSWSTNPLLLKMVPMAVAPTVALARGADPHPGRWQSVGASVDGRPVGGSAGLAGRVSAVAVVPGSTPTLVAGTLGGIWIKAGGGPWRDVTSPRWPSTAVNSLAVDPTNPQILFAGTGYDDVDDGGVQAGAGILKSINGGKTWTPLVASVSPMRGYAVTGLAVDPRNDQVVVAAANNGLFRSGDGGSTWTEVLPIKSTGVAEVRLTIDSTGLLLAGVAQSAGIVAAYGADAHGRPLGYITTGHAIYRSTDSGQSWSAYAVDLGTGGGQVLVPAIAQTYAYALDITGDSASGLYTSSDGGQSWELKTTQTESKATIAQLVVDPQSPTHAYFAQEFGPFAYTWGNTSVQTISGGGAHCFGDWRALTIGPAANSSRALYGGDDGGFCSYDFGTRTFTQDNRGLVSGLDYFGAAQSSVSELSGAQDLGVDAYRGGADSLELYGADGNGVLIDQNHPNTYYADGITCCNGAPFVVSHDAGAHWAVLNLPTPATAAYGVRLVQASGAPKVLILPEINGTLYVSTDDGSSWTARTISGLGGDYLTSARAALIRGTTLPVIYVGTGFGSVWRSSDLGASWTNLNHFALTVRDIAIDATGSTGPAAEHVFLGLGVWSSRAYGTTKIVGDVMESRNSGATWTDIGKPLSTTSVNALLLSGSTLLVGTNNGVQQYRGGHWSTAGSGFPNVRVNDLFISADGQAFFATTYGRGTWMAKASPPA